jgi:hypothetical protein
MIRWILAMIVGGWLARGLPAGGEGPVEASDAKCSEKHGNKSDVGAVHDVVRGRRFELVDKQGNCVMTLSEVSGEFRCMIVSRATGSPAVTLSVDDFGYPQLVLTKGNDGFWLAPLPTGSIGNMGEYRFKFQKVGVGGLKAEQVQ